MTPSERGSILQPGTSGLGSSYVPPIDADALVGAALALARRFSGGGRLLISGFGDCDVDARHVAVEFIHPVIVGKRALPALRLPANVPLAHLASPRDALLVIDRGGTDPRVPDLLEAARACGTLRLVLGDAGTEADADHQVRVEADDVLRARELQVSAYHVLWELVHMFREHPVLEGTLS